MKPTRDDLEARWRVLQARGHELDERQKALTSSLLSVEEKLGKRALAQLHRDRADHERDLLELRQQMIEHGGFDK